MKESPKSPKHPDFVFYGEKVDGEKFFKVNEHGFRRGYNHGVLDVLRSLERYLSAHPDCDAGTLVRQVLEASEKELHEWRFGNELTERAPVYLLPILERGSTLQ